MPKRWTKMHIDSFLYRKGKSIFLLIYVLNREEIFTDTFWKMQKSYFGACIRNMLMTFENNDIAFLKAKDKQHFLVPFPLLTFSK